MKILGDNNGKFERTIKDKKAMGWSDLRSIWYCRTMRCRTVDGSFGISRRMGFDGNMLAA